VASFLDVCRFTPTLGGTTDWIYSSAVTGYQGPAAAGAVNGSVYRYRAESADLSQWENGFGAYNSGTTTFARTTVLFNSSGGTSKISFSTVPQVAIVALAEDLNTFLTYVAPTFQTFLTSSGTYTTPAGVKYIKVRLVGGGGGGNGGGNNGTAGNGGAGGNTTFGTSLLTGSGSSGTAGAAASGGDVNISGGSGNGPTQIPSVNNVGGGGAASPFGGGGGGAPTSSNGIAGPSNTGSGGGGGSISATSASAFGGKDDLLAPGNLCVCRGSRWDCGYCRHERHRWRRRRIGNHHC
jgi:hypothetical protein